jgi:hypothetical protein
MLLNFSIHCKQNKTWSGKCTCVKKCMFTAWCHIANWSNRLAGSVTLSSPVIFFHWGS